MDEVHRWVRWLILIISELYHGDQIYITAQIHELITPPEHLSSPHDY
jgi:hypothetical protein